MNFSTDLLRCGWTLRNRLVPANHFAKMFSVIGVDLPTFVNFSEKANTRSLYGLYRYARLAHNVNVHLAASLSTSEAMSPVNSS